MTWELRLSAREGGGREREGAPKGSKCAGQRDTCRLAQMRAEAKDNEARWSECVCGVRVCGGCSAAGGVAVAAIAGSSAGGGSRRTCHLNCGMKRGMQGAAGRGGSVRASR